jgi:nicotinamide mononucleotide (NMN) deamidase PncC
VSNTGVAGPSNGDGGIPVGTICFAWGFEGADGPVIFSETRRFDGDRNEVRKAGAEYAIERIVHYHEKHLEEG